MNYLFTALIFMAISRGNAEVFDRFSGKKLDTVQMKELRLKNATERCSINIKVCTPHEGSRVDGTCNNYKYPSRGAAGGPYLRLLEPDYGINSSIRMSKVGAPLPSARKVRTSLQSTGRVDKSRFTVAVTHYLEFIHRDVSFLNASRDFLKDRTHCCQEAGKLDSRCIPVSVPKDDPYLKVTDIRCLNFSRAKTFQESGCTSEIIPSEQINFQTPLLDLSTIYGVNDDALSKVRKGENGLLVLEKRNNRDVPRNINNVTTVWFKKEKAPKKADVNDKSLKTKDGIVKTKDDKLKVINENATETENLIEMAPPKSEIIVQSLKSEDLCIQNKGNETTCYQFGFPEAGNYGLRTTALGIFFMREHNRIAKILHKINPCWKDDRLFKVSRQINIATASNIFMYELLPLLLNFQNMESYELVTGHVAYTKTYDEDIPPQVYAEYEIAMRYFHTLLDGRVKEDMFKTLDCKGKGININGDYISHLRFADDIVLMAESLVVLNQMLDGLASSSRCIGLEIVSEYTYLGQILQLYSENHHYKGEFPLSETLYRQGLIEHGENFEEINRGTFFQSSAKIDDIQDPEISDNFFGDLQKAHDLSALDIQRGRDMGLRGYNSYRQLCSIKAVKQFDDLLDIMDVEKVEALRRLYDTVDDIDLLAGIMSENFIQGTFVGPVLFCIMTKQLQIFRYSDRFWYERGDQVHSFTLGQLLEIRKTNMARLACDNADGIRYIQPQAFLNVKPGNSPVPCAHISGADLSKWKDDSCHKRKYAQEHQGTNTRTPMSFIFQGADSNFSTFFDDLLFYKPSDTKSSDDHDQIVTVYN